MAFKKYVYSFTETAERDIDETLEYMVEDLTNPDAAKAFVEELEAKLEEICKNPKAGHIVDNPYLKREDVRRFLVANYIGYYVFDEQLASITVLRLVYGKRNQNTVVRDL